MFLPLGRKHSVILIGKLKDVKPAKYDEKSSIDSACGLAQSEIFYLLEIDSVESLVAFDKEELILKDFAPLEE